MSADRPIAFDQAEGLRRIFGNAPASHARGKVIGFISAGNAAGTVDAIDAIAHYMATHGDKLTVIDEQSPERLRLKTKLATLPEAVVIERPCGQGAELTETALEDVDFVLVNAYPAKSSQITKADCIVLVSRAPDTDMKTVRAILKALNQVRTPACLLINYEGNKLAALDARKAIEETYAAMSGRALRWLGALPAGNGRNDETMTAIDGAVSRLRRIAHS